MQSNERRPFWVGGIFLQILIVAIVVGLLYANFRTPSTYAKTVAKPRSIKTHADSLMQVVPYSFYGESYDLVKRHFVCAESISERRRIVSPSIYRLTVRVVWLHGSHTFGGLFDNGKLVYGHEFVIDGKSTSRFSTATAQIVDRTNGGRPSGSSYSLLALSRRSNVTGGSKPDTVAP